MKKRIITILLICILVLTGCGKKEWEEKFAVSEFKYNDKHVKGEIKNLTNIDYIVTIYLEYTSGSIKEEGHEKLLVKSNSTEDVDIYASSIDDKYKIDVKNIEFEETLKIDTSSDKKLTSNEFSKAFYNAYELHLNIPSMSYALINDSSYHYNNEEIYYVSNKTNASDSHIYIYGALFNGAVRVTESYKSNSQKPEVLGFTVSSIVYMDNLKGIISGILDGMSLEMYGKILSYTERATIYDVIEHGGEKFFGNFYIKREYTAKGYEILIGF